MIADALCDVEPDEPYIEGVPKKLVERRRRWAREEKKQKAAQEEIARNLRGKQGHEFDALATRLVELDRNVARNVLRSTALFGPCGYVEMFSLDSMVLAQAIQKALGNEPQFAVEEQGAAPDDGLDIPEGLRRTASTERASPCRPAPFWWRFLRRLGRRNRD